jgi:tellurite resistance protein TehA-like permease
MSTRIVREGLEPEAIDVGSALPWLATMHPASFAMVMATGIVSVACLLLGPDWLAAVLLWVNVASYLALWALTITRAVRYGTQFWGDVSHHGRGVGFFTTVAATNVLGTQMLLIEDSWNAALLLWVLGTVLWALVTYTVFTALTVKTEKPPLAQGLNGGWLVSVVAAQSVAALGAQLAPGFDARAPEVLFLCLAIWLGAGMLYVWLITLIFYRYTFFVMSPADLAPPYWINMGAVAISTLAGATLVAAAPESALLQELLPFIKGLTLLFWATATWWIPMLLILGVWRHVYRRFPLRYDPLYWGAVFPLGMYTVCTFRLAGAIDAPYLMVVPEAGIYVALVAWTLTTAGLLWAVVQRGRTSGV